MMGVIAYSVQLLGENVLNAIEPVAIVMALALAGLVVWRLE